MSCIEASHLFLSSGKSNFDTYANYTVYLCAQTLGVLFGPKSPHPCTSCQSIPERDGNSYVHRWGELFSCVEQWYENRPSQMMPIFTIATTSYAGREQPFPTVLYGNGDASMSAHLPTAEDIRLTRSSFGKSTVPCKRPFVTPTEAQNFVIVEEAGKLCSRANDVLS